MSDQNKPQIIVREFRTVQNVRNEFVDEVLISPAHDPLGTATWLRIKELIPPQTDMRNDDQGTKKAYMVHRWSQIEPAYKAWKDGVEIPLDGTPLAAWSGLTPAHADVFRQRGIKTVEAIAEMTDTQIGKIALPNARQLRDLAQLFLDNRDKSALTAAAAEKDAKIAAMEEMLEEMSARIASMDGKPIEKRGPGRPRKEAEAA